MEDYPQENKRASLADIAIVPPYLLAIPFGFIGIVGLKSRGLSAGAVGSGGGPVAIAFAVWLALLGCSLFSLIKSQSKAIKLLAVLALLFYSAPIWVSLVVR